MGFFDNQERTSGLQAVKATPPQPVQEIVMVVEYFDSKFNWDRSEHQFSISESTVFYQPSMDKESILSDKIRNKYSTNKSHEKSWFFRFFSAFSLPLLLTFCLFYDRILL